MNARRCLPGRGRVQRDALRCWKTGPGAAVMCAMQRDETVGLLQMDLTGGRRGCGHIPFRTHMDPAHRRSARAWGRSSWPGGIHSPASGRDRLRLCCAPDNGIAQRFYQKYGFATGREQVPARPLLDVPGTLTMEGES